MSVRESPLFVVWDDEGQGKKSPTWKFKKKKKKKKVEVKETLQV